MSIITFNHRAIPEDEESLTIFQTSVLSAKQTRFPISMAYLCLFVVWEPKHNTLSGLTFIRSNFHKFKKSHFASTNFPKSSILKFFCEGT